jgi:hypothetical protein
MPSYMHKFDESMKLAFRWDSNKANKVEEPSLPIIVPNDADPEDFVTAVWLDDHTKVMEGITVKKLKDLANNSRKTQGENPKLWKADTTANNTIYLAEFTDRSLLSPPVGLSTPRPLKLYNEKNNQLF